VYSGATYVSILIESIIPREYVRFGQGIGIKAVFGGRLSTDLYTANFGLITETELYKGVQDLTRVDLPIPDRSPEGYLIDFKEKWSDKSLRVVASFANTFGGIIIIGVSENGGKADKIVGEASSSELKTRLAGAIAANITPTPLYDIAECTMPTDASRRLAVIRVRSANRVHYLLKKGESPVYIRNEDQSIPAPAAELRQLIEREREALVNPALIAKSAEALFARVTVTSAKSAGTTLERHKDRTKSKTSLKIAIVPEHPIDLHLDYQVEDAVDAVVAKTFPMHYSAIMNGVTKSETQRSKDMFLLSLIRESPDIETKWLLSSKGEWVYATVFALDFAGRELWSLLDLGIQLLNTVSAAHFLLLREGYVGQAALFIEIEPGRSALHVENGTLPALIFGEFRVTPWPQVIPHMPTTQHQSKAIARATSTFHTRTAAVDELLADVLNQLLRDLNYAADLNQLRIRAAALAKRLPQP
jgi:schlafen family protein